MLSMILRHLNANKMTFSDRQNLPGTQRVIGINLLSVNADAALVAESTCFAATGRDLHFQKHR